MQALAGIRIVDLGDALSAYCGKLLVDQGATVTLVEPASGSLLRRLPPFVDRDGDSYFHVYYNAGKRSVVLDADRAGDAAAVQTLVAEADVVIAPGAPAAISARWGVTLGDPAWLEQGGVWLALTPFGTDGPYADYEATHLTTHAMSGMHDQGPADGPPVSMPGLAMFDEAGIHAAMCIVAALRRRTDAGGQVIDISVQEVVASMGHILQRFGTAGFIAQRGPQAIAPPAGTWQCSDGFIELQVWQPAQWTAFVELLGSPAELAEPSWIDRTERQKAADRITPVVAAALREAKTMEVWRAAQAARIPSSPVNTLSDFVADGQVHARDFFTTGDGGPGASGWMGRAYRVDGWSSAAPFAAPRLGEHDEARVPEGAG